MQILINPRRHLAPFGDGPDDEGGAALGIAAGKDAVEVGHEVLVDGHAATGIVVDAEAVEKVVANRAGEAHGEQHEVGIQFKVRIRHRHELAALELDPVGMQFGHMTVMAGKLGGRDTPLTVTAFFVRMRGAKLHRPERPRR